MRNYILTIFLLTPFLLTHAQERPDTLQPKGSKVVRNRINTDSIIPDTLIFAWRMLRGGTEEIVPADTNQIDIVYHDPIKDGMLYNVGLGNIGQAILQTDFNKRLDTRRLHWSVKHFNPYLRTFDKTIFFNTKSPYTRLYYISGPQEYQTFHFIHTQNINRNINFGARYDIYSSEGYFVEQDSRNRNGSFWFNVKNYRYRNNSSINFNRIQISNNGGIVNNLYVTDYTNLDLNKTDVRLLKTGNDIRLFDGFMEHEVALIQKTEKAFFETGLANEIHYALTQRKYYDPISTDFKDDFTNEYYDFYTSRYNNLKTEDTLSFRLLKNAGGLFVSLGKSNKIRIAAMMVNTVETYRNSYRDTLFKYINDTTIITQSALIRFNAKTKNENIQLSSHFIYNPNQGYRKNEYDGCINLTYRHRIWTDTAFFNFKYHNYRTMPDYFMMQYYSNHYKWQKRWPIQDFSQTQLRCNLVKSRFAATFQVNSIKNHLWLDQNRVWNLSSNSIKILGFGIEKTQNFGKYFSLRGKLLYQYSNDSIIDLPQFATSATALFQTPVHFKSTGGELNLQIGVDCWINSSYYVPNFDPALNQFFMQRSMKIGDYPFVDVFISAQVKRMVMFARFEHITAGLKGSTYFDAYNYPTRPLTIKIGVSWTFYD